MTFAFDSYLLPGPLDFRWCYADTVVLLQNVVASHRLAVDPDQVVGWLLARHLLVEKLFHCGSFRYGDIICEPGSVVVDVEKSHLEFLSILLVNDLPSAEIVTSWHSLQSWWTAHTGTCVFHGISFQSGVSVDLLTVGFAEGVGLRGRLRDGRIISEDIRRLELFDHVAVSAIADIVHVTVPFPLALLSGP